MIARRLSPPTMNMRALGGAEGIDYRERVVRHRIFVTATAVAAVVSSAAIRLLLLLSNRTALTTCVRLTDFRRNDDGAVADPLRQHRPAYLRHRGQHLHCGPGVRGHEQPVVARIVAELQKVSRTHACSCLR